MNLSEVNFNTSSFTSIWTSLARWWELSYSGVMAVKYKNGRAIKYFNSPNDVLIDITDAEGNEIFSELRSVSIT